MLTPDRMLGEGLTFHCRTIAEKAGHPKPGTVQRLNGLNPIEEQMENKSVESNQGLTINEVELILAEKRTALSAMRTGIAVFALPMSVLSFLIATSRYYDFFHEMHLLVPLLVLCAALVVLGSYLIIHSIRRIHHY